MNPRSEVVQQKEMVQALIASLERDIAAEAATAEREPLQKKLAMAQALLAEMETSLEILPSRPNGARRIST